MLKYAHQRKRNSNAREIGVLDADATPMIDGANSKNAEPPRPAALVTQWQPFGEAAQAVVAALGDPRRRRHA
jgi:hypothetical protein